MTNEERKALVERLRDEAALVADDVFQSNPETIDEAADQIEADGQRIAELEAALRLCRKELDIWRKQEGDPLEEWAIITTVDEALGESNADPQV